MRHRLVVDGQSLLTIWQSYGKIIENHTFSFGEILMIDIKNIIAKNISELRQLNNMTQLELAEKLNYSDKTISKWERAESTPDIAVLIEIAELFGVDLDYLVKADHTEKPIVENNPQVARRNRKVIACISECGVWIAAIFAFVVTTLVSNKVTFQFLYFIYALPLVLIVKLIFNSIWFNPRNNYYIISFLMWSIIAAIHITFLYFKVNIALIYLIGLAFQVVIFLCSFIRNPKIKKNK